MSEHHQQTDEEYVARVANARDVDEVISFMKKHFYSEETILKSLLLKRQPSIDQLKLLDEDQTNIVTLMTLNSPCIAIIHKPTQTIVAMSMMIASAKASADSYYNVYTEYQAKSTVIDDYVNGVATMIETAQIYKNYPSARSLLELDMMAVDRDHARRGLAVRLLQESLQYATNNGFDIVDGLFTSDYARKAAEKVGMTSLMDYQLEHWCGLNGAKDLLAYKTASLMVVLTGNNGVD